MRESIYTIPLSEAFEDGGDCPFCGIRSRIEEKLCDYITGPAMMEPDIRIKTNEAGFCRRHYDMTLERRNRLAVALMLQTRLDWLLGNIKNAPQKKPPPFKKALSKKTECFVCGTLEGELWRMAQNAVVTWAREPDFRALYENQPYICLKDYELVVKAAREKLRGKPLRDFLDITGRLAAGRMAELYKNVSSFCAMYDYKNAGENVSDRKITGSLEDAIDYLT